MRREKDGSNNLSGLIGLLEMKKRTDSHGQSFDYEVLKLIDIFIGPKSMDKPCQCTDLVEKEN